jgi:hypothetical protein
MIAIGVVKIGKLDRAPLNPVAQRSIVDGIWVGARPEGQPPVRGHPAAGVNTMAKKTSKKSAKVAKKTAVKRAVVKKAKPGKPGKAVAKSKSPRGTKLVPNAPAAKSKGGAATKRVKLLSGGNPQIAKAYGDAPVQAYIAAMPGWKRDVGRRLDAIIERAVPNVYKAVKWNSPFYGIEGEGWFLGLHCLTKYVKVAFFRGASLRPVPPGKSKQKDVRYLDIYEDDELDEAQLAGWVKQASKLPGEKM